VSLEGIKCPDTVLDAVKPYTLIVPLKAKCERPHDEPMRNPKIQLALSVRSADRLLTISNMQRLTSV